MRTDVDRDTICPGPDPDPRPAVRLTVPPGAVDTHAHVVGDTFVERRSYTPPPAPGSEYLRMLDATGMTHGVLIQISVHGADNSAVLDVLAAHCGRLRGVAVVAPDVADTELGRLADAGVVGVEVEEKQMDLRVRLLFMNRLHESTAGSASICLAAASRIPGSVVEAMTAGRRPGELLIGHPSGVTPAKVEAHSGPGGVTFDVLGFSRTARRLMDGTAYFAC